MKVYTLTKDGEHTLSLGKAESTGDLDQSLQDLITDKVDNEGYTLNEEDYIEPVVSAEEQAIEDAKGRIEAKIANADNLTVDELKEFVKDLGIAKIL